MQVREKGEELEEKIHGLEKAIQGARTTWVDWYEPHVIFGGMLGVGLFWENT